MKKLLLPIAAAALAAGLSAAPVASADDQSYLADLANDGFTGQSGTALKMGYAVCTDRAARSPAGHHSDLRQYGQSVGVRDANYIYDAAVIHLC